MRSDSSLRKLLQNIGQFGRYLYLLCAVDGTFRVRVHISIGTAVTVETVIVKLSSHVGAISWHMQRYVTTNKGKVLGNISSHLPTAEQRTLSGKAQLSYREERVFRTIRMYKTVTLFLLEHRLAGQTLTAPGPRD